MKTQLARWACAAACALTLLAAPGPADARVTVTVEFAYGAVVAGGVGIFIAFGGSWDVSLAERGLPTALLEVRDGTVRAGLPLLSPRLTVDGPERATVDGVQLDLLRWRF